MQLPGVTLSLPPTETIKMELLPLLTVWENVSEETAALAADRATASNAIAIYIPRLGLVNAEANAAVLVGFAVPLPLLSLVLTQAIY
jgi:hypothetical protein